VAGEVRRPRTDPQGNKSCSILVFQGIYIFISFSVSFLIDADV